MMRPRWKLEVEGLGKIERAEVEIRPLMLFVGENNTGKSYLASLLWGLLASSGTLFDNDVVKELPSWSACGARLRELLSKTQERPREYTFSEDDRALFTNLFNEALDRSKGRFVQELFHTQALNPGKLRIEPSAQGERFPVLHIIDSTDDKTVTISLVSEGLSGGMALSREVTEAEQKLSLQHLAREMALAGLANPFGASGLPSRPWMPVYLPASRTGFLLLYKAAARRSLHESFRRAAPTEQWLDLTAPAFDFIDLMAFGIKPEEGIYKEEADLLEREIGGSVELVTSTGATNEVRYRPDGGGSPLTMSLSSSLVTELAPIILVLRHMPRFPVLILEEPEAHLHPKLQRRLAQVIARLIRKGLYVWITTHSENFCQQINNFLKLGSLAPDKRAESQRQLGYAEQDYLDLEDVAGYQFTNEGERSVVSELKKTKRGLVMPTFNRELTDLSKETLFLQRQTTEEG